MGELDEVRAGSGWGSGRFGRRPLPPARAVGDGVERCRHTDVFALIVLDVHDGAGVWVDHELDVLAGELVRDFELLAVIRDGAVTAHQAFDAMPEELVELRGERPEQADPRQVLLVARKRRMLTECAVPALVIDGFDPGPKAGVQVTQLADMGGVEFGEEQGT